MMLFHRFKCNGVTGFEMAVLQSKIYHTLGSFQTSVTKEKFKQLTRRKTALN